MPTPLTLASEVLTVLQNMLDGINNNWPAGLTTIKVNKTDYAKADLVTKVEGMIAIFQAVPNLEAELKNAQTARDQSLPTTKTFIQQFMAALPAYIGNGDATIESFGGSLPKPRKVQTTAEKQDAAKKRLATRAARHTMGKNQKKGITGATVAAATLAPATPAPATPAPATPAKS